MDENTLTGGNLRGNRGLSEIGESRQLEERLIVLGEWHHRVGAAAAGWLRLSAMLTNAKQSACRAAFLVYYLKAVGCALW
jgi:hypothetical protein